MLVKAVAYYRTSENYSFVYQNKAAEKAWVSIHNAF